MVALPIERLSTTVSEDGRIHHDERALTWAEADAKAGRRLDRRRLWAFVDGELCRLVRWSQICTGCSYDTDYGSQKGGGCEECGYHGVVRNGQWVEDELFPRQGDE